MKPYSSQILKNNNEDIINVKSLITDNFEKVKNDDSLNEFSSSNQDIQEEQELKLESMDSSETLGQLEDNKKQLLNILLSQKSLTKQPSIQKEPSQTSSKDSTNGFTQYQQKKQNVNQNFQQMIYKQMFEKYLMNASLQQQLFNIQTPSNEFEQNHYINESQEGKTNNKQNLLSSKSKKIKKVNECGHPNREHYAKGMCNTCYHKYGRTKKPWNCEHEKLYAHGLCQNCYINKYNQKRRESIFSNPSDEEKLSNDKFIQQELNQQDIEIDQVVN